MSTHFTAHCLLHECDGPVIRRSAGTVSLLGKVENDGAGGFDWSDAIPAWQDFLIEHESCPLVIYNERSDPTFVTDFAKG